MKRFRKIAARTAALLLGLLVLSAGTAQAEEVLRLISSLPRGVDYTERLVRFVALVNERGEGVVQVRFVGGPETIPHSEQGDAIRRGIIDMQYGPASFYSGMVAEADALVGATKDAMETRENGGLAILREVWKRKLNAYLLGHFDSGMGFYIFLRQPPEFDARGVPDLSGVRMRSQPIYREFFAELGAQTLSIPAAEAYTAFERGLADGTGWPLVGFEDLGWGEVLDYRIDPPFFQTDLLVLVNQDRWRDLPEEARRILEQTAIDYEKISYDYFQGELPKIDARLRDSGLTVTTLDEAAAERYLRMAYRVAWERLLARDKSHARALYEKFYNGPPLGLFADEAAAGGQ